VRALHLSVVPPSALLVTRLPKRLQNTETPATKTH
jgi:hypothetical protein